MYSNGDAQKRKASYFLNIGMLLQWLIKSLSHTLSLRIFMAISLVQIVVSKASPLCRIALARKRVVNRFYYPRRFAVFRRSCGL